MHISLSSEMNEIAILDFGSQYTHLIARRIRELGVKSHIYPNDVPVSELHHAVGIILSGGPRSLVRDPRLPIDEAIFDLKKPILGLCYGHQLIADHFGGTVESGTSREYGVASIKILNLQSSVFNKIPEESTVWMSHGDHVEKLPDGFEQIASSGNDSIAAMADVQRKIYGFQFHPEVNHSEYGMRMLRNFVFSICNATTNWTTDAMLEEIEQEVRERAGDKQVFLLVSGGVDSTVCFALLKKVLGKKRIFGLHVDHGYMRQGESREVMDALAEIGYDDLHIVNAEEEFMTALTGVIEPEAKRKIIGEKFVDIVERVMTENGFDESEWLLGQGTIYPDTIESGDTKNADKIKTHHNRVDRIRAMIAKGLVIEPIHDLYKDEVREIGKKLGLPPNLIERHPFPGPGLAIRCLCAENVANQKPTVLPLYHSTTLQHCNFKTAIKLPIQSVGVQGDERSYAHPAVLIRDNVHEDMWKEVQTLAPIITNTHTDINRVLVCVSGDVSKIISSIVTPATLTKKRISTLRIIDRIVQKHNKEKGCRHIWQFPVIMIPFGYEKKESIVLRPVESKEAMTVSWARLPDIILSAILSDIHALGLVDFVFYDVTNKPPGTIEWE